MLTRSVNELAGCATTVEYAPSNEAVLQAVTPETLPRMREARRIKLAGQCTHACKEACGHVCCEAKEALAQSAKPDSPELLPSRVIHDEDDHAMEENAPMMEATERRDLGGEAHNGDASAEQDAAGAKRRKTARGGASPSKRPTQTDSKSVLSHANHFY